MIGAIFVVRQMQEKLSVKSKKPYFGFMDLEKVFDRVPRGVIRWAMCKLGVDEWLVSAVCLCGCMNSCYNSPW